MKSPNTQTSVMHTPRISFAQGNAALGDDTMPVIFSHINFKWGQQETQCYRTGENVGAAQRHQAVLLAKGAEDHKSSILLLLTP